MGGTYAQRVAGVGAGLGVLARACYGPGLLLRELTETMRRQDLYLSVLTSLLASIALLPSTAGAQDQGPRTPSKVAPARAPAFEGAQRHVLRPRPELEGQLDPRNFWQDRLIVKFAEGIAMRLSRARRSPARDLQIEAPQPRRAELEVLGDREVEPLFSRPAKDLERERRALRASRPDAVLADLANYYRVFTAGREDTLALMAALAREEVVEVAYPEFHPRAIVPAQSGTRQSPDIVTAIRTPSFEARQGYLASAPQGLGMLDASGLLGSQGHDGQVVVQIEAAWTFDHEDLPQLRLDRVLGPTNFGTWDIQAWRDHGTAAVGILAAARDDKGFRGIVPEARHYVSSVVFGNADAVSRATQIAGPGDVFTSSLVHAVALQNQGFHAPFDYPQDAYDAVRIAVAKGIVFTVAAGNTGNDLANPLLYGYRYAPSATPSGAWIVGASFQGGTKKVSWSNYGDVVRFSAWGAGVTAPAYGTLFRDPLRLGVRDYTDIFGGTSAASPQVAGAAAAIQSTAWMMKRRTLDVEALARALERHGTWISGRVGPRPDIAGTLVGLGLVDGLMTRGDVEIGGDLDLTLDLRQNEFFAVFGSSRPMSLALPGFSFPLALDPAQTFVLAVGTTQKAEPFTIHTPLAVPQRYSGARLYFQAMRLERQAQNSDFTNPVSAWLR